MQYEWGNRACERVDLLNRRPLSARSLLNKPSLLQTLGQDNVSEVRGRGVIELAAGLSFSMYGRTRSRARGRLIWPLQHPGGPRVIFSDFVLLARNKPAMAPFKSGKSPVKRRTIPRLIYIAYTTSYSRERSARAPLANNFNPTVSSHYIGLNVPHDPPADYNVRRSRNDLQTN